MQRGYNVREEIIMEWFGLKGALKYNQFHLRGLRLRILTPFWYFCELKN